MTKRKRLVGCEIAQAHEDSGRFTQLPDELLITIFTCMEIDDAIRASASCNRFRHMWKHVPHLKFNCENMFGRDTLELFQGIEQQDDTWREHVRKFTKSVSKTLRSRHRGVGLETFEVEFPLDRKYAKNIDKWISSVLSSGAKELHLILGGGRAYALAELKPYRFPCKRLTRDKGHSLTCLSLHYCCLRAPPCFDGFKSLKVLELDNAYVTDVGLQNLVSSCSVLEQLSVINCCQLSEIKISLSCAQLKILDVCRCQYLDEINISALNLASFQYEGQAISFNFKNSPQLTNAEIFFEDHKEHYWSSFLIDLPFYLPQLESIVLHIPKQAEVGYEISMPFSNLIHLALDYWASNDDNLLWIVSILNAAPVLESLDVQAGLSSVDDDEEILTRETRELRRRPICPHYCLKTFRITGFIGNANQIELAIHVLQNSVALESIILSPTSRSFKRMRGGEVNVRQCPVSDEIARHCCNKITEYLRGEVPQGVELVIL